MSNSSKVCVDGINLPILLLFCSVNQRLSDASTAISTGLLEGVGIAYSFICPPLSSKGFSAAKTSNGKIKRETLIKHNFILSLFMGISLYKINQSGILCRQEFPPDGTGNCSLIEWTTKTSRCSLPDPTFG